MGKEASVGTWQKEFFQNKKIFTTAGFSEKDAEKILKKFLYLCSVTPLPRVMETFQDAEKLNDVGVHTPAQKDAREFMLKFLAPIFKNFSVKQSENIELITPLLGKYPITILSNHLSHLDAPAIFYVLYDSGDEGKLLAESLIFIAGRLAFLPDFTRLGLYMFDTLLVCSQRDLSEQISQADLMTKINMRSYRTSQELIKKGKILTLFPEGTRSRSGRLGTFVDTAYHYIRDRIVVPISLEGTEKILPTSSYIFNPAAGTLTVGKPVVVGKVKGEANLPDDIDRLPMPHKGNKKTFIIDNLALLIGMGLHHHRHGTYRNLYKGDILEPKNNQLISPSKKPDEKIVVLGHSQMGTAIAAALANKNVEIKIFIMSTDETVKEYNEKSRDLFYYPFFKLPPNIRFTSDSSCFKDASLFIQAESPWLVDELLSDDIELIQNSNAPIVNVAKGLSSSNTGLVLSDLQNHYNISKKRLAAVAGAVIPYQLMERKFTGQEAAAYDNKLLDSILPVFNTGYLYTMRAINPNDVIGVQLGSALKTMYALGIGILDGYFTRQLGGNADNTIFQFTNRIFRESKHVGIRLGAIESTFDGLSGLSDFMLSCFGAFNNDRNYGYEFSTGNKDPQPTHGLYSLRVLPTILDISGEQFPILKGIYAMVIRGQSIEKQIIEFQRTFRNF
jgi:glycerol-3-phosphate dehydrogenase/1-acyl-sn-glycerol-3-phosphate acyltransferase